MFYFLIFKRSSLNLCAAAEDGDGEAGGSSRDADKAARKLDKDPDDDEDNEEHREGKLRYVLKQLYCILDY